MKNILSIAQLAISLIVIILVLLQERGSGIGDTFGGSEGSFMSQRRGIEKILFIVTIVFLVLFAGISLANLLV